ncbi:MAG: AsmA family protein [Syntrophaceae bacterium]|nr:MAG: AsmA family protein [Syntrophaceae bacterium]
MKKRTLIKGLLIVAVALIVLVSLSAGAWFYASYQLSQLDTFREKIMKVAGNALDRDLTYEKGKATLTIRNGLSLQFTNLVIREKDRSSDLLNIGNAFFRVDLLPLLVKRVVLRESILDQPHLSLKRNQAGILNIADLLFRQKKTEMTLELRNVTIEKGVLIFTDQTAGAEGLTTSLTNLQCRIDPRLFSKTSRFSITATLNENKNQGALSLTGTFRPSPFEKPIEEGTLDASIRLTGMEIHHYQPYLRGHVSIEQLAGRLDLETTISGTVSQFTSKGTVTVKDALLTYPRVFREPLRPRTLQVEYILTRNAGNLTLEVARGVVDRVALACRFAIQDMDKEDPLLAATAATSAFPLTEMQSYVPWGIIPQGVGRFIEAHVTRGDFRLVEGKLSGRLSQIADMMKQENAGVLSIRAEVKQGVFVVGVGNKTPDFQDISGVLELKNRQFSLRNMTGRFGTSPCKIDGGISDFALSTPVVYTADMTLQPARNEVLWLLGSEKFRNLTFDGSSTLHLSGKGPAENYQISARWDLTQAGYAYPDVMEKTKAKPNQLSAEIILNKNAVTVSSYKYDLSPVTLNGSATYSFTGKKPLSVNVQSNTFDIREAVSILPGLRKFDPAGSCLIDLAGRSDLSEPGSFLWKGNVSFTNVAFKPSVAVKPVSGLTGVAAFNGNRMETSLIKARIGDSVIQGKCGMRNFQKAKLACEFDTPLLKATDVGLFVPEGDVSFQNVKGQIAVGDSRLHVDRLSLTLGKSIFNFSGDVPDVAEPKIVVTLNSPYIHSDDVARLMTFKYSKQGDDSPSKIDLDLTLRVDAGVFNGFDFKKLGAGLKYAQGILSIETLEAGILDGSLKGKGRMEIRPDGQNRYQANFSLDKISLEKFKVLLDIGDRTLIGKMSLAGDVTATGSIMNDFTKTATGTFKVRAEKGVLKKFSVFSKIFSLLNVSQLLKFQLPDMAKDGMPYTSITASLLLKNGVLSSDDFLIDSDAMKISGVGKVDLLKKELDNIVGVHPLQTLDRIAARIPIAGWVLTDEGGHLITVHFKVDGNWDDPNVSPIPVRSLAKGTLDTFRRLFQLPEKLITDTGDVILGR